MDRSIGNLLFLNRHTQFIPNLPTIPEDSEPQIHEQDEFPSKFNDLQLDDRAPWAEQYESRRYTIEKYAQIMIGNNNNNGNEGVDLLDNNGVQKLAPITNNSVFL
jgi:hypothetical protein